MRLITLGDVLVVILTTSFLYVSFILEKLHIIVKVCTSTVTFLVASFMPVVQQLQVLSRCLFREE